MEVLDHLIFGLEAEIQNAILGINTPAELVLARQFGYNDADKRININDGTAIRKLLQDNDISTDADFTIDTDKLATRETIKLYIDSIIGGVGTFRGDHDASAGVPTATEIKAGDYWRITTAGTITGITPIEDLSAGDLLFAKLDSAANGADFFAVQGNFATAADIALLTTGTYAGAATNVQDALEELYVFADIQLASSLEWQPWINPRQLSVKISANPLAGIEVLADGLATKVADFVTGAAATGTEILASVGTGANAGKIVLDSDAITAAVGDYVPLAGTAPGKDITGDIWFEKDSAHIIGRLGSPSGPGNTPIGSIIMFEDGIISVDSYSVTETPWKGLRYYTGFLASSFTPVEQANGHMDRFVPDIAYVKSLIAGGGSLIPWATKAGDGINYAGSIYNIDLDTNSGLELNGTSPDGKLRIKGLADYSAVLAGDQVALGYNAAGNLIADKSTLTAALPYLPLAGNTAGTPMTGKIYANSNFIIENVSDPEKALIIGNPDGNVVLKNTNTVGATIYGAEIDLSKMNGATFSGQYFDGSRNGMGYLRLNGYEGHVEMRAESNVSNKQIFAELSAITQSFRYSSSDEYRIFWDSLAVGVRDRILPDIGYVKTLIGSSVDFASKAGQGIDYTGSIYNIDLDTNSGLELNGTSPDGKLRIKGLADYSAVAGADQVALGYGTGGNLVVNKALFSREAYDITGNGATRIYTITHSKGAYPLVQIYRVDTGNIVNATINNLSATETRITFGANVPNGRVHKVVIG